VKVATIFLLTGLTLVCSCLVQTVLIEQTKSSETGGVKQ